MRREKLAPGEYYHILNRGVLKQDIFNDDADRWRFLFSVLYLQASTITISDVGKTVRQFRKKFYLPKLASEVERNREIELVSFTLMPNHFHLIVGEKKEGGISKYTQRLQNSYTKYRNKRHELSGHLFQGPYRMVHIKSNEQLIYLSAYVHRNPRELAGWKGKENKYFWSSYRDYLGENRWGNLLIPKVILDQFKSSKEYEEAVESSRAKELPDEDTEILLE